MISPISCIEPAGDVEQVLAVVGHTAARSSQRE
jgi:hypothetical protein